MEADIPRHCGVCVGACSRPDAVGTVAKPFEWFAGIRVAAGYHYTNGVDVALAVADGVPATFDDERFLVKL